MTEIIIFFFRFHCPFCKATTELPPQYFVHLDHTGVRLDKYQRPELWLGSYEFVGTKEYCRNNTFPKPPAFIFVIDVSYNNVKSGLVHLLCQNMKNILKHLPREIGEERSAVRVGFITYSNEVHFYNIKSSLAQPQMLVVGDVQVIFLNYNNQLLLLLHFTPLFFSRICLCLFWMDFWPIQPNRKMLSTS